MRTPGSNSLCVSACVNRVINYDQGYDQDYDPYQQQQWPPFVVHEMPQDVDEHSMVELGVLDHDAGVEKSQFRRT